MRNGTWIKNGLRGISELRKLVSNLLEIVTDTSSILARRILLLLLQLLLPMHVKLIADRLLWSWPIKVRIFCCLLPIAHVFCAHHRRISVLLLQEITRLSHFIILIMKVEWTLSLLRAIEIVETTSIM